MNTQVLNIVLQLKTLQEVWKIANNFIQLRDHKNLEIISIYWQEKDNGSKRKEEH
jgi:hypothetical protein